MATRQRTRRRTAPAPSLPRPPAFEEGSPAAVAATRPARRTGGHRAHHVTTDYHYVRRDLLSIGVVSSVCLAFIFGVALYIGAI